LYHWLWLVLEAGNGAGRYCVDSLRCCGWIALELLAPEGFWPPQLAGLLASISGMVLGSLMPQWVSHHAKV
jgi:hypothetical protein